MIRLLLLACCLSFALPGAAQLASVESIPVDHKEPITIRVLDGKSGEPVPNLHLVLFAGYTESDVVRRFWREQVISNLDGEVRLPRTLLNFPFLEALLIHAKICQANARGELYRIERIRNDGWQAPNDCGVVPAEDAPGVLTIFVNPRRKPGSHAAPLSPDTSNTLDLSLASKASQANPNEIEALLEHEQS